MKKSICSRCTRRPATFVCTHPGGIVVACSVLLTAIVSRDARPKATSVGSSGRWNGRWPPSCSPTSTPLSQTRAWWFAEPTYSTTRCVAQCSGTKTVRSYHTTPTRSRSDWSCVRSLYDAGTGIIVWSEGRPAFAQPRAAPSPGSGLKLQRPSSDLTSRDSDSCGRRRPAPRASGSSVSSVSSARRGGRRHFCVVGERSSRWSRDRGAASGVAKAANANAERDAAFAPHPHQGRDGAAHHRAVGTLASQGPDRGAILRAGRPAGAAPAEQRGPSSRKGAAFNPAEEAAPLAALGLSNGELLFLDYQVERENQAKSKAYANDLFRKLAKEGELRAQGTTNWTLTNFLDYRSTKEFVLEAPPEPHTKFVQLDARATATLMNFMLGQAFSRMRVGHLYGKWAEDGEGAAGVEVHAIYEPKQDNTDKEIRLVDDAEGEAKADAVAAMLGLVRVGVVIAHPAREYAFTINELLLASKLHAACVEKEGEKGKRFVTVKARPVLEHETEIEGVATVEAYQMTDQCVALCAREGGPAFTQSKTDPRVAKTAADCCFVVEKKEQRKAAVRLWERGRGRAHTPHFISRATGRTSSRLRRSPPLLGTGFAVENRPSEPQAAHAMAEYLRNRASRKEPFLTTVSEFHLLCFLTNMLDMSADMPALCGKVREQSGDDLDGFQMMIRCYAGLTE